MGVIEITDVSDPRISDYRDIRDRQLRGPEAYGGLFVAEQPLIVEHMLRMPGVAKSVLVTPGWVDRIAPLAAADVPVYAAALPIMTQVAGFEIHRGVLGMGRRSAVERESLDDVLARPTVTLLLCEDVSNIDNIGLLFRNAAAFGADGVVLSGRCHDPLYSKSLRVSIGHALTVPFVRSRDWAADLTRLKADWGITLVAAAASDAAVPLDSIERVDRLGLVVGPEYDGLPRATLDLCDRVARIPMAPGVDSLNVAVAAAVCLHRLSTGGRR